MSKVMSNDEFVKKAKWIATDLKTLYVLGGWGQPLNSSNKKYLINKNSYNKRHTDEINKATSDTFAFDCVCFIKSILWGFNGDVNKSHGGAIYNSNGVDDVNADVMMTSKYCDDLSSDFTNIEIGEVVGMTGHIGIYIGNGQVVEATAAWEDKVLISNINNKGIRSYKSRQVYAWNKHGKLKYIDYVNVKKSVEDVAKEVINGFWGNGTDRKKKLEAAGYNYNEVQSEVNEMLKPKKKPSYTTYTVKKGDGLIKIGQKLGKDWKRIASDNGIAAPKYIIYTGQVLKIYQ